MKLAIVGTSVITRKSIREVAEEVILNRLEKLKPSVVVSGGARGIDTIARKMAESRRIETATFRPENYTWQGFSARNLLIAKNCDRLICITTSYRRRPCYHCNVTTHDKTAGCWTMNEAKKLGKEVELIVI